MLLFLCSSSNMNHKKFISIFLLLSFVNIHDAYSQNFFTQKANNLINSSANTPKLNSTQSINLNSTTPPVNNIPSINTNALKTQTAICENLNLNREPPKFSINFTPNELIMDYSKRSKDLIALKQDSNRSGFHLLGLFKGSIAYTLQPSYKVVEISPTQYCAFLNTATINIQFNPVIYISKEVQQFQCSYNRVLAHEKQHYRFESTGLIDSQKDILNALKTGFPYTYYANSIDSIKNEYSNKTSLLNKNINQIVLSKTAPKHASIDTDSNYELESKQCDVNENITLTQTIKNAF